MEFFFLYQILLVIFLNVPVSRSAAPSDPNSLNSLESSQETYKIGVLEKRSPNRSPFPYQFSKEKIKGYRRDLQKLVDQDFDRSNWTLLEFKNNNYPTWIYYIKGRHLVVKEVLDTNFNPRSKAYNAQAKEDLKREYSIMRKLNHKHIAGVFFYGDSLADPSEESCREGYPLERKIMIMEGSRFRSIFDYVKKPFMVKGQRTKTENKFEKKTNGDMKKKMVTIERKKKIIRQTWKALNYLHSMGYGHFDLKAKNIINMPDGIRLIDFGTSNYLGTERLFIYDANNHAPNIAIEGYGWLSNQERIPYPLWKETDYFSFGWLIFELITKDFDDLFSNGKVPFFNDELIPEESKFRIWNISGFQVKQHFPISYHSQADLRSPQHIHSFIQEIINVLVDHVYQSDYWLEENPINIFLNDILDNLLQYLADAGYLTGEFWEFYKFKHNLSNENYKFYTGLWSYQEYRLEYRISFLENSTKSLFPQSTDKLAAGLRNGFWNYLSNFHFMQQQSESHFNFIINSVTLTLEHLLASGYLHPPYKPAHHPPGFNPFETNASSPYHINNFIKNALNLYYRYDTSMVKLVEKCLNPNPYERIITEEDLKVLKPSNEDLNVLKPSKEDVIVTTRRGLSTFKYLPRSNSEPELPEITQYYNDIDDNIYGLPMINESSFSQNHFQSVESYHQISHPADFNYQQPLFPLQTLPKSFHQIPIYNENNQYFYPQELNHLQEHQSYDDSFINDHYQEGIVYNYFIPTQPQSNLNAPIYPPHDYSEIPICPQQATHSCHSYPNFSNYPNDLQYQYNHNFYRHDSDNILHD
jgi:serine/threonine protein kinase